MWFGYCCGNAQRGMSSAQIVSLCSCPLQLNLAEASFVGVLSDRHKRQLQQNPNGAEFQQENSPFLPIPLLLNSFRASPLCWEVGGAELQV